MRPQLEETDSAEYRTCDYEHICFFGSHRSRFPRICDNHPRISGFDSMLKSPRPLPQLITYGAFTPGMVMVFVKMSKATMMKIPSTTNIHQFALKEKPNFCFAR